MAQAAAPGRYTRERYLALVGDGVLDPDARVELLEGVIVGMPPESPAHAAATDRVAEVLRRVVGSGVAIRIQHPLDAGAHSVPEPDVAVVPGRAEDYATAHPAAALLVVEVADASLVQDRLTKTAIYAAAGIPEYWIVNLRDDHVEVHRTPDRRRRVYADRRLARRGERLAPVALPGANLLVDDVLPLRAMS
jgi:Uma2 family endonuclease